MVPGKDTEANVSQLTLLSLLASAHALSSSVQLVGLSSALTSSGDPRPAPTSFAEASPVSSQHGPPLPLVGLQVLLFPSSLHPGSPAGL